jgi:hypothetical protein
MATDQLEFTPDELLADPPVVEPLRAGGILCHGGYLADGTYASPRTANRVPAIEAWQARHRRDFGTEILDAPLESWPGNYPNLAQARFLLANGVRDPMIAQLTRIGTVEGFGANIRRLAPVDMQRFFVEDIRATATSHLGGGLVEAHARDEAGWDERAGHDTMWFAVRDIAFEHPLTQDTSGHLLERLGFAGPASSDEERLARFAATRSFPDLDTGLEMLLTTMIRVLFVEIKAFHIFAWAEALLSDPELVAGDGAAASLVACIRADETPHVEYLRTSLSEMRDRTFVTTAGRRRPGAEVIGSLWDRLLVESMGSVETNNRSSFRQELVRAVEGRGDGRDIIAGFDSLGDWRPAGAA